MLTGRFPRPSPHEYRHFRSIANRVYRCGEEVVEESRVHYIRREHILGRQVSHSGGQDLPVPKVFCRRVFFPP